MKPIWNEIDRTWKEVNMKYKEIKSTVRGN